MTSSKASLKLTPEQVLQRIESYALELKKAKHTRHKSGCRGYLCSQVHGSAERIWPSNAAMTMAFHREVLELLRRMERAGS